MELPLILPEISAITVMEASSFISRSPSLKYILIRLLQFLKHFTGILSISVYVKSIVVIFVDSKALAPKWFNVVGKFII